jgi:hypothetical protein
MVSTRCRNPALIAENAGIAGVARSHWTGVHHNSGDMEILMPDSTLAPTSGTHLLTFCGKCNCGCPELYVDHDAAPERRIVITDDFGQRIQMSVEQLEAIVEEARAGRITSLVVAELAVGGLTGAVTG